jgi:hypothetical protein
MSDRVVPAPASRHRAMWVGALALYGLCFAFSRAPYFAHYFAFRLDGDYGSYAWEAQKLLDGIWPDVAVRPPGYILFLAAYGAFSQSVYGLLLVQNLVTVLTGSLLIYSCWRWRPHLAVLCAVALVAAQFGGQSLNFDTSPQSDSLLGNFYTLSFACLVLGVACDQPRWLSASSAAMALAIWTKPAGLFLAVIVALGVFFIWRNRGRATGFAPRMWHFATPVVALLLSLSLYNATRADHFGVSSWGEMNVAGATMILWETDPSYPSTVNNDIERLHRFFDRGERNVVRASRDVDELYATFYRGFNVLFTAGRIFPSTVASYSDERAWIRRVAVDSIWKNRDIYAKFVASNLWFYYTNRGRIVGTHTSFHRGVVPDRARFMVDMRQRLAGGEAYWIFNHVGEDYLKGPAEPLPGFVVTATPGGPPEIALKPSRLLAAYETVLAPFQVVFHSVVWTAVFVVVWAVGAFRWLFRGSDLDAFLVVTMGAYVMGSAVLVSLVEMAIPRYSYSTLTLFYLTVLVGISVLLTPVSERRTA